MKVGSKLFVILAFVALAPLGVFAVSALRAHERALREELAALHQKTADHGARSTTNELESARRAIGGLARAIPWRELSEDERAGALLLAYNQLDDIAIATLLDEHGNGIGASVYRDQPGDGHPEVSQGMLAAFGPAVPGSAPFVVDGKSLVAIGIALADGHVLAIALSLRGVCAELAAASPRGVTTRLETADGRVLCGMRATSSDVLTASASTSQGWVVTAEQPRAIAFASLHGVQVQSLVWIVLGAIGAIIAGAVLAQAIHRPLRALTRGVESLATGDLRYRVTLTSRDEFGALARSFNHMGDELEKRTEEIRDWNRELQDRVDARTKELREAQDQLLQSKKLGAVAALGAGVAHEINNPLTGVLGLAQVLIAKGDKLDDKTRRSLASIEREALRIRDIVERVGKLAQTPLNDARQLSVRDVVEAALAQRVDQLASKRISVEPIFAADAPRVLGNADQLQYAIGQIVDNAMDAMSDDGRLRIGSRSLEGDAVVVEITDSGRGIAPEMLDRIFEPFFTTKTNWRGAGLGLATVHRIVEAHQGSIRATSSVGAGTTMTITLPAASRAAHLA